MRGWLQLAPDPDRSRVDVSLDLQTVTTGNPIWDDMLRAADSLRIRANPLAYFSSSAVHWTGNAFVVGGELHLAGVSTALELRASVKSVRAGVTLRAQGTIEPRAAGIRLELPGARLLVPRSMKISIIVTAVKVTESSHKVAESPSSTAGFTSAS